MKFVSRRGSRLSVIWVAVAVLAGCAAQAPAPVTPAQQQTSPTVPGQAKGFQADLLGRSDCPPGQALFAVPWENSPQYDPLIRFVRAPDPVKVCAQFPESLIAAYLGRKVPLERLASGVYQLQGATAPAAR